MFEAQKKREMRFTIFIAAAALIGITTLAEGQTIYEHNYLVKVGDTAPDFTVK